MEGLTIREDIGDTEKKSDTNERPVIDMSVIMNTSLDSLRAQNDALIAERSNKKGTK